MRTRLQTCLSATLLGIAALLIPTAASGQEKPQTPADDDLRALEQFSRASQILHKMVSRSLVHVKFDQIGMGIPQEWRKPFEEWRQKQGGAAGGSGAGAGRSRGHGDGDLAAATTMPGRGANLAAHPMFKKFLEQTLKESTDPEMQTKLKAALAHLEAIRAGQLAGPQVDMIGVVIDDQGHAVVAGWIRENPGGTYHVTVPDGTEMTATYVGAHWGRGIAVLKIESAGSTVPAPLAATPPAPGELLMCLAARQGAIGWVTTPAAPDAAKTGEERFPIAGEDRGGSYLFNTKGQFAAVGIDRWALPMNTLKSDIDWIIKNNKDIPGLGVRYVPVSPELRKSTPALGDRPAVLVSEIAPGSAADRAKLKKNDIVVTIDGRSVSQLFTIQSDLATKTGTVSMGILRAGKEMTLDLPLGE